MTILSCEQLSFVRNKQPLLSAIDWQVEETQNWAILGLNGAGKSLLLQLITGQLWPSSGKLTVLGTVFGQSSIPELRQKIAWISPAYLNEFPEHETAEKIVVSGYFASVGVYQKVSDEQLTAAKKLLVELGLEEVIGRTFHTLSQGQKQLVGIARSLINRPKLLILDEPTNGLDLFAREEFLARLHQLVTNKQIPNLVLVTHHTEEITTDFTHVLLLRDGQIVHQGLREECLTTAHLSSFYQKEVVILPYKDTRFLVYPA